MKEKKLRTPGLNQSSNQTPSQSRLTKVGPQPDQFTNMNLTCRIKTMANKKSGEFTTRSNKQVSFIKYGCSAIVSNLMDKKL